MKHFVHFLPKLVVLSFLLLLLLMPERALAGAKQGLLLWFHQVLPALLPFFIVSGLMTALGVSHLLSHLFAPLLCPLFHLSKNAVYPVLIGFLSGLPVGAKTVADFVKEGRISKQEGNYLLPLCNNSGPFFILSYIAVSELEIPQKKYLFLFVIYASSILTAFISYPLFYRHKKEVLLPSAKETFSKFSYEILDNCILNSFELLTKIGGYLILFSILAETLPVLLSVSEQTAAMYTGLFEITTGIHRIAALSIPLHKKTALIAALTSLGGLSGLAQTKSAITGSGLSMFSYVTTKAVSCCFAYLLSSLINIL